MRIACNGEIWQDGSFSIAGMLALQELVRRGHTIEFYNVVEESRDIPGVEVLTFRNNPVQDFLSRFLPIKIFHPINVLIYEYLEQPSFDQAAREASKRHAEQPYDALLFLGYPARFKIDGVPTVSWLQGAPQTEVEAFVRLKDTIISICGSWRYWQLRIAYKIKECVRSLVLKESTVFSK